MAPLQLTIHFRVYWDHRAIFESSLELKFNFALIPEGFLEHRSLYIHCGVNPDTGRVSFAVQDREEANMAMV